MNVIPKKIILSLLYITLTGSLLFTWGCQSFFTSQSTPDAISTEVAPATPKPISTAADTISSNPEPTVITLVVWTTENFSPQVPLIAEQIDRFRANNPNVEVNIILKKTTGQASTLNYLKSARDVAPSILPDVVVLNIEDLLIAWRAGLIQPIGGLLDRNINQDLLPAARNLVTIDEQLVGIPFEMNVQHLIYNTTQISTTPLLWTDVLSNNKQYGFSIKNPQGLLNDASIIQYLSAGAKLTDAEGQTIIDEAALRSVLNYYQAGITAGIFQPANLDVTGFEPLLEQYKTGQVSMIHIDTHQYLNSQHQLSNTAFAPLPSKNGNVTPLGRGWALAVVTKDAARQKQAVNLIETLMTIELNTAWATTANVIPTRQTAFSQIANNDPYWLFLANYIQAARSAPTFPGYDHLSRILQQAVMQVVNGEETPEQAIETAINALRQQ